jgi:Transposase DNA-binding/Transposase Tn5 dimerisation domain
MVATMEDADWAVTEFGGAELGDRRRTERLVRLATALGSRPQASLPQACDDPALLKAAYRFFENEAIEPAAIVDSHVQATLGRIDLVDRVLAVQDTTHLDGTVPAAETGLWVHTTLALTPERVPLGVLAQEQWTRPPEEAGKRHTRRERAISAKESHKWLTSLAAVCAAKAACPQTHFISVGDREADVYDLFLAERPVGVDLLVRAAQDRRLAAEDPDQQRLRAALAASPVAATATVEVPRQGARPARTATLAVHWQQVTLRPPKARAAEGLPEVTVWAVWATETGAPPTAEPLDWLLLTTVPVQCAEDALERLAWYACRWGIEVYHKVLKSGCAIERRQLADLDHLQRGLALYSVIAWRLLYATMLARVLPDVACTVLLEEGEWQALYCHIHQTTQVPATPPPLTQAVRWIAQLGGFLGRPRDGAPGVTVLWRGFQRLVDLTAMYHVFRPPPRFRHVGKG